MINVIGKVSTTKLIIRGRIKDKEKEVIGGKPLPSACFALLLSLSSTLKIKIHRNSFQYQKVNPIGPK